MAIKHSDPRRLQDLDLSSNRFEGEVADAWATRHEDPASPARGTERNAGMPGRSAIPRHYRDNNPTYQPFADLRGQL